MGSASLAQSWQVIRGQIAVEKPAAFVSERIKLIFPDEQPDRGQLAAGLADVVSRIIDIFGERHRSYSDIMVREKLKDRVMDRRPVLDSLHITDIPHHDYVKDVVHHLVYPDCTKRKVAFGIKLSDPISNGLSWQPGHVAKRCGVGGERLPIKAVPISQ